MNSVKKIAITGPESTGKSTLSRQLAVYYETVWALEFARKYLDELDRPYEISDLTQIANGQISSEREALLKANNFVFCDTELTVLKIWSEHKYGKVDPLIIDAHKSDSYDLYLLMNVDLDWEADPQRENPKLGKFFLDWFERELALKSAPYRIISGSYSDRFKNARKVIEEHFSIKS